VGSATVNMTGTVYMGLVVTSHNSGQLCTANFTNVTATVPNNAPVITETDPYAPTTIPKNGTLHPSEDDLNATDANSDTLTWWFPARPAESDHTTTTANGTVSVPAPPNNTGNQIDITYTPDTDYTGTDTFVMLVEDGKGGVDAITVNIVISDSSRPVAEDQFVDLLDPTSAVQLTLTGTDADEDTLTFSVQTEPDEGSQTGTEPNLSYSAAWNFDGLDLFTFKANDGTMDSAKTLNLLAVAHNYRKQGKRVLLVKPQLDDRFGTTTIASRSGLEAEADLLVESGHRFAPGCFDQLDCVLVDEAQFLSPDVVDQLRRATIDPGVPVICYGLRTDFQTRLFAGSKRLLELADRIEEVKVTCQCCQKKATFNLRTLDGQAVVEGPQVQLGADEQYLPVCWKHYDELTAAAQARLRAAESVS